MNQFIYYVTVIKVGLYFVADFLRNLIIDVPLKINHLSYQEDDISGLVWL